MVTGRIAVGGSAANPPHLGHVALVDAVIKSGKFDKVVWIVSGLRTDKMDCESPDHRVAMTLLTFPTKWLLGDVEFVLNFDDAYSDNTPTIHRLERMALDGGYWDSELVWFTGVDVFVPQENRRGKSEVVDAWVEGNRLMEEFPFLVVPRDGFTHPSRVRLPERVEILDVSIPGIESTTIRHLVISGQPIDHLVTTEVDAYIRRHNLYR